MNLQFRDEKHEEIYEDVLQKMISQDAYHQSVAYLLSLDIVLREHINDVFDFDEDAIKPKTALQHPWQTGTSRKTTRLLMNLWNGCTEDYDEFGNGQVSHRYAVDAIFSCDYSPYYWEAIKLRFPACCDE